jgi:hypothetical protein
MKKLAQPQYISEQYSENKIQPNANKNNNHE